MRMFLFLLTVQFISLTHAQQKNLFFLGDWIQNCATINEDDYVKTLLLIDTQVFDHVVIAFEDDTCKAAYLIFKRQFKTKKISIVENTSTDQLTAPISGTLEATVEKVTYQSLTDEVTESLNLIEYCGYSNWVTFQETDVTGKNCQDYKAPDRGSLETFQFSKQNQSSIFFENDPKPFQKLM